MQEKERLSLDCELLRPIKENFEYGINLLTKNAIVTGKEGVKINIAVKEEDKTIDDEVKAYSEPIFKCQISEKIKEEKGKTTATTGENYSVEIVDDKEVVIKNMNQQTSLFDKEEKQMDENKVVLSLDKYMELYDHSKKLEKTLSEIGSIVLNTTELNNKHDDLIIDSYDLKTGRLLDIIKENFPKEYETRFNVLRKDEE